MLCSEVMHKGVVDSKGDEEERMVDVLGRDECFRRHGQVQVPLTAISGRTASPCLPLASRRPLIKQFIIISVPYCTLATMATFRALPASWSNRFTKRTFVSVPES